MKKKKIIITIISLVVIGLYISRVYWINNKLTDILPKATDVIYNKNEKVEFENDYIDSLETDAIPGYSIELLDYDMLNGADLYRKYNLVSDNSLIDDSVSNNKYCLLKLKIYNDDNDDLKDGENAANTGINCLRFALITDNDFSLPDTSAIFMRLNPDFPGSSFSLRKGTDTELYLPFKLPEYAKITKTPYLEITEYPTRKLIKLE